MSIRIASFLLSALATAAASQIALKEALLPPLEVPAYGDSQLQVESQCLSSGKPVAGTGRTQYCVDVPEAAGQKLVVTVKTATAQSEAVKIGDTTFLRRSGNESIEASGIVMRTGLAMSTAIGPIIEVKPFQQPCERCDACPCIGCGHRCECSCNALCRIRRETSCAHTAGALAPGRWYVSVDAPGDFLLTATLVGALSLRAGALLPPRTLWGATASQQRMTEGESEGRAFSDYFFYDPKPHEKLSLSLRLLRTGSAASWVDVYVRFGEMPTTELYDAKMRCDRHSLLSTFVLQADRLLNERLCVLVVGRGDSFVVYSLATNAEMSGRLLVALAGMGIVFIIALLAIIRTCKPSQGSSVANTAGGARGINKAAP